ncbi:histidine triad (HIT) family protein [Thermosporothrix hazakensis]|jgi:histidine triad (HIT) family protein|uniref:Histidine triad (HIT) family protein n=2 Tax=Thermosporothrix TaxID=768650 RepID=A0A326U335_THEHA|nr:histidine triad nucleotide-binding protein [Thermosporothrix hazakensis]PZW25440.1 histidine triad (HIT) family protein [Thermosporothrix hazakensis]BBH90776.1 histidine triad nucleotide-binding protein [Thermosporothrix sp. COM3]GCE48825.1 histidine triad nucleotide-binding protein [Thermosporothrix hazakensis]
MADCLFCKIAAGEIPGDIVYQDQDVVAFNDIHPQAPHHILIIPRAHIASMAELKPEHGDILMKVFTVANQLARDLKLDSGYRFVTNIGPDAGQSVNHLHFHLLGGRQFGWPPG